MFNQTCDRLREFKKNGSSLKLGLTLTLTPLGVEAPMMNMISPQSSSHASRETFNNSNDDITIDKLHNSDKQMMTIFYGGRVFVLDNISSHKANEIMRLANSGSSTLLPDHTSGGQKKLDLSQTRTRSLMRFFEKRNDRIKGRAPYVISDNTNKLVEPPGHKSWLQLAAAAAAAGNDQ